MSQYREEDTNARSCGEIQKPPPQLYVLMHIKTKGKAHRGQGAGTIRLKNLVRLHTRARVHTDNPWTIQKLRGQVGLEIELTEN